MSRMRGASRQPDSLIRFRISRGAPHARQDSAAFSFMPWHHWHWMRSKGSAAWLSPGSIIAKDYIVDRTTDAPRQVFHEGSGVLSGVLMGPMSPIRCIRGEALGSCAALAPPSE